jgi:hypothetical protein
MAETKRCKRSIQDFSRKHFLSANIPVEAIERLEDLLPGDWKRYRANGDFVYRFNRPLTRNEEFYLNGVLADLYAEYWEYGEYGAIRNP